jgi:hypothetical protein
MSMLEMVRGRPAEICGIHFGSASQVPARHSAPLARNKPIVELKVKVQKIFERAILVLSVNLVSSRAFVGHYTFVSLEEFKVIGELFLRIISRH